MITYDKLNIHTYDALAALVLESHQYAWNTPISEGCNYNTAFRKAIEKRGLVITDNPDPLVIKFHAPTAYPTGESDEWTANSWIVYK